MFTFCDGYEAKIKSSVKIAERDSGASNEIGARAIVLTVVYLCICGFCGWANRFPRGQLWQFVASREQIGAWGDLCDFAAALHSQEQKRNVLFGCTTTRECARAKKV